MVVLLGQPADDVQRLVEVAVDGHDPGAGDERLEQLAEGDLALGQDDDDLQAGGRAVGRGAGRGVAGRGADDRPAPRARPPWPRPATMPAVLERAGRVLALDLEVQVRRTPMAAPSRGGVDERRGALAEGQRRRRVGDRQEAPIAVHEPRPGRHGDRRRTSVIDRVERDVDAVGQDRGERGASLGQRRDLGPDGRAVLELDRRRVVEHGAAAARRRGPPARTRTSAGGRRADRRPRSPAPVAGASPAHVEPTPRATATRSPRTALLVAAPPAPGPARRTVPSGSASISTRLVTPSVQPNGLSAGTAVGMTAASMAPSRRRRRGRQQLDRQAEGRRALQLAVGDAGDPRPPVTARGRGSAPDGRRDRASSPNASRARMTSLLTASSPSTSPRRVGLGIAQLLGVDEDVVVGPALLGHRGQDVVGRAVDDAADARRPRCRRGPGRAATGPGCRHRPRPRSGTAAPVRRAVASSSGPWWAMTCLLAVTTGLPAPSAAAMSVRAGSSPPITSTMTSVSGSATRWAGASVRMAGSMPSLPGALEPRTATPVRASGGRRRSRADPGAATRPSMTARRPSRRRASRRAAAVGSSAWLVTGRAHRRMVADGGLAPTGESTER